MDLTDFPAFRYDFPNEKGIYIPLSRVQALVPHFTACCCFSQSRHIRMMTTFDLSETLPSGKLT